MVRLFEVSLVRAGRAGAVAVLAMVLCAGSALATRGRSGRSNSSGGAGIFGQTRSSSSDPFGRGTLKKGSSGSEVALLQFYLDVAGYFTPVSGDFGSRTQRSVMRFQGSYGLRQSGQVGRATGRALGGKVAMVDRVKPDGRTQIHRDGTASAPSNAPAVVNWIISAANRIVDTSYCYAGGHGTWKSSCYDCSGSVSYALHGGGLLNLSEDSTQMESYGAPGKGRWVSIYANSGHAFLVVAGRAFDTADFGGPNRPGGSGPRWRWNPTGNLADGTGGYIVRHPPGL